MGINFLFSFILALFLVFNNPFTGERKVASVHSKTKCLYNLSVLISSSEVKVSDDFFIKHNNTIKSTISGNLATVLRSEWKAKGSFDHAKTYLVNLFQFFKISPPSSSSLKGKNYLDYIFKYLRETEGLKIRLRDPPSPQGVKDETFTYYTKPILADSGKHQFRIRRYVRQVDLDQLKIDEPILGTLDRQKIEIKKLSDNNFQIIEGDKDLGSHSKKEMYEIFGEPIMLFAFPHGKAYKLEVKTRPNENILINWVKNLMGNNYVQKLSINLDHADFLSIFGDDIGSQQFIQNVETIKSTLKDNPKNDSPRVEAIMDLLKEITEIDSDFLRLKGSTQYQRYAFEIEVPDLTDGAPTQIQSTIDYNMSTREVYDDKGFLLHPFEVLKQSAPLRPFSQDEDTHIELKVPKFLVQLAEQSEGVSNVLEEVMKIFDALNVTNTGKFNHINEQRPK